VQIAGISASSCNKIRIRDINLTKTAEFKWSIQLKWMLSVPYLWFFLLIAFCSRTLGLLAAMTCN
jgi:hypothetical protein